MREPFVYMMANRPNGVLYIGVTSNLPKRAWEHRNHVIGGFTKKYRLEKLVWFESHDSMDSAISREKKLKKWKRAWKIELIEAMNPEWRDLYEDLVA